MVDNENQWEDLEYSEDNTVDTDADKYEEENYTPEEYSDDDYEEEYTEDETEKYNKPQKKNNGIILIVLLLLILLLGAGVFFFLSQNKSENPVNTENNQQQEVLQQNNEENNPANNTNEVADMFFDQANSDESQMVSVDFNNQDGSANVTTQGPDGDIVANVTPQPQENVNALPNANNPNTSNDLLQNSDLTVPEPNNTIMVSYNPKARQNPFKPPVINPKDDLAYQEVNNTDFEIIEPPVTSVEDENLTKLLQTQISGILYDDESPSAIVNLNGVDQFVKIGDTVAGYKIQNITRDKVQISYKNNSYVASVGELFVRGALDKQRAVANLENKFAGRYKNNN